MATPRDYLDQIKALYGNLNLVQRLSVLGVILVSVMGFGLLFLYANKVEYKTLYTDLSPKDGAEIVDWLKKEGVKYRIVQGGSAIQVPSSKVYDVRLALASAGLPRESGVGFEIFDQTSLGATDFVQKVNYQRALQGELERTIARFPEVKSVRVHIAEPKETLFVTERRDPSASVLLTLKPGATLSHRQLMGIVHLVSSAVPRLRKERVSIMDTSGEVLLQGNEMRPDPSSLTAAQIDYQRKLETYYKRKIQSMLEDALGPGKAVARVSVDVDFDRVELNEDRYDPDLVAVRSEQKTLVEEQGNGQGGIPGVKGGLATKLQGNTGLMQGSSKGVKRQESVTNYEITRINRKVIGARGKIVRISAGVLVDGTYKKEGAKEKYVPRTPEEMKKLEEIVKAAMGYSEERGDEIQVVNVPFTVKAPEEAGVMAKAVDIGTKLIRPLVNLILAIIFLLFVVRPLLNKYVLGPKETPIPQREGEVAGEIEAEEKELEAPPVIEPLPSAQEELRDLASDYPERAAALIKVWLREPVGAEE